MDQTADPLTPDRQVHNSRIVARHGADGSLVVDGLPSRAERERIVAGATEPDALAAGLPDADQQAVVAERVTIDAIEAGAPEEKVAALLAQTIRRSVHAEDLRRSARLTRRTYLLTRQRRCGARARASRPAASRTRGSRRGSTSRAGPSDDPGGEPDPAAGRRPSVDLTPAGSLR